MDVKALHQLCLDLPIVESRADERAWLIMPGGGSHKAGDTRLTQAEWDTEYVYVCGTRGDPAYSIEDITRLLARDGQVPKGLWYQGYAEHTLEQMLWAVDSLRANRRIRHLVMSTAEYHLPRCMLTFVKQWQLHGDGRKLQLSVAPTANPPQTADTGGTNASLDGELSRILEYQKKGDVATEEDLLKFLTHKFTSPSSLS